MKRSLLAIVVLVSIFSILFASAYTPPPPVPKYLQLFRFRFKKRTGYVFVYNMSGEFTKEELVGWVFVEEKKLRLDCWLNTPDARVTCSAKGLKGFVGKTATVVLAGYENTVIIPEPVEKWYCYGVFDLNKDFTGWENIGEKCLADEVAQEGMAFDRYSPIWDETYTYLYQDSTPCTGDENGGFYFGWKIVDNYYWIPCP